MRAPHGADQLPLIRAVAGRVRLDQGQIELLGRPLDGTARTARRSLGVVPQEIALYPLLTARENLEVFGRFHGLGGAAVMLVISTRFQNPLFAMLAVGLASFGNDLAMPGGWGACMEVGGKHAGSLSGSMNMMGNFGGAVAPLAAPFFLGLAAGSWNLNFYVFAGVYVVGAVCWFFIDPVTPLEEQVR